MSPDVLPMPKPIRSTRLPLSLPSAPKRDANPNRTIYAYRTNVQAFQTSPQQSFIKPFSLSPFDEVKPWDADDPPTWPTLYLPFHLSSATCDPSHIEELLINFHYKGFGARVLRALLFKVIDAMETEVQNRRLSVRRSCTGRSMSRWMGFGECQEV